MLQIIRSMRELDFLALMKIYVEGNMENGAERWPEESQGRQLQLAEEAFRDYLRHDFFTNEKAAYYLWTVDGICVSALRLEPYKDGWLLEALETGPENRRRGYGENLIRSVLALSMGTIYSHVHKANGPSLAIHEKCGFCRISEAAAYIDGSVNDRCCTMRYTEDLQ